MADLRKDILQRAEKERVKFMRLQFTDILGVIKNVEVPDGQFGENLTTQGLDVNGAEIGERWRIGDEVVVEVTMFRTPCHTFKAWMARSGYDDRAWLRRFAEDSRPGAYLRVVVPGVLQAGDPVAVVRPGTGPTVTDAFRSALRL